MTLPPDPSADPSALRSGEGTSRVLRIALVLSLAANLLILGLILGASFSRDRDRDGRRDHAMADIGFNPFIMALPADDRRALGAALVGRAGDLRQNRAELRRQFETLLTTLRSEPFDTAAAAAAVAAQQARLSDRQDIGRELLIDRLEAMAPAERAAYADALEQAVRHGRRSFHERSRD
jgi:hypothetical protein